MPTFTFLPPKRVEITKGNIATRVGEIAFVRRSDETRAADVGMMLKQLDAKVLSSKQEYVEFNFYRVLLIVGRSVANR